MNENVVAGTPLTKNQIAVREMPEIYVPEKAVDPDRLDALLNHAASVPLTRGEVLLWTQFGDAKNFSGGWGGFTQTPLSQFDVVRAHKADLKDCFELFLQEHPTRHGVVTLRLKYSTEGAPFDVRGEPTDAETSTMVGCVVEAASKWRVHGGPGELALPLTF